MTEALTPPQALAKAIEFAGSQSSLARICGVTQAAVWKWLRDEKALPPQHVLSVECATGISRHTLRPDIYRHKLDAAIGQQTACTIALAEEAGRAALEMGEAVAASITLTLPGATPRDHVRALAEAQDAQTAIGALTRRLSSFLPSKLSLAAGKAGGHYQ